MSLAFFGKGEFCGIDKFAFRKKWLLCIFRLTKASFSCNIIFVFWGYSSAGRALEWHSRGQRFDPAYLHQSKLRPRKSVAFVITHGLRQTKNSEFEPPYLHQKKATRRN